MRPNVSQHIKIFHKLTVFNFSNIISKISFKLMIMLWEKHYASKVRVLLSLAPETYFSTEDILKSLDLKLSIYELDVFLWNYTKGIDFNAERNNMMYWEHYKST